jgi:hypothetical protein
VLGLISAVLLAGYTLVYAAVADGGRFAATPWEAFRSDAYQGASGGAAGVGSGAHHPTTWDVIIGAPGHRGALGNWVTGWFK